MSRNDYGMRFGEQAQYFGNVPDGRQALAKGGRVEYSKGTMPARNKKNFRPTKKGAGMTEAGVKAYRRLNPGSKLKTAVTGKVKPGSKAAKRRKSYCARSLGQLKRASAKLVTIRTHVSVRQEGDGNVKKTKD